MRALKPQFDFYINSSIHVALAVVSLSWITALNYEFPVGKILLLYIFFGTLTGYNFVKFAEVAGLHHRSLTKKLRSIQIFSFLCFLGLMVTALFVEVKVLLWSAFFGIFTLLYALPILKNRRNFRSIPGIKIFIIGFVWAGVTVVLPIIQAENAIFGTPLIEFLQRFLLVLVWILPFEIRDLQYDLKELGTLPQQIGVKKTKLVGWKLLGIVVLLELLKPDFINTSSVALFVICAVTAIVLWKTRERQSPYFSTFWVEGIPILWLIILLLLRSL